MPPYNNPHQTVNFPVIFWTITSSLLVDAVYTFYRYSDVFFWILHTSWQTQYTLISLFGVNDSRRLLGVFHYSDDNLKYDAFLNDKQLLLSFGWTYFIYQAKVKHSVTSEFTKAKIYKSDVILTMLLLMTVGFLLLLVTPGGAGWHCFTHFVLMVFVNFLFLDYWQNCGFSRHKWKLYQLLRYMRSDEAVSKAVISSW